MKCRRCKIDFIPETPRHRFCSGECKKITKFLSRKRYRTENKEKIIASSKNYTKRSFNKRREYWLKKKYNISLNDYNIMLTNQNNSCGICQKTENYVGKSFAVDHCHDTGKVRGILCDTCNRAIGLLNDNIETLSNAIEYLKKHKEFEVNNE